MLAARVGTYYLAMSTSLPHSGRLVAAGTLAALALLGAGCTPAAPPAPTSAAPAAAASPTGRSLAPVTPGAKEAVVPPTPVQVASQQEVPAEFTLLGKTYVKSTQPPPAKPNLTLLGKTANNVEVFLIVNSPDLTNPLFAIKTGDTLAIYQQQK